MPLTDLEIKKAKPREKRYTICDGKGLNLEIRPSGSKAWYLRYRENGKENTLVIGSYPAMSLSEARNRRDELKSGDFNLKALHAHNLPTFQAVAQEWMENQSGHWVPRHAANVRRILDTEPQQDQGLSHRRVRF